ncbi:MAG TPA: ABC transporter permease [Acidimicrobiales bacterium]|nr:ABC transporter permease [Acidimicrobiales bacterium]
MATETRPSADPELAGVGGGAQPLDPSPTERTMRGDVWRRFRRNKLAMVGLGIIVVLVLAALLAPVLSPYGPNAIDTTASRQPPSGEHWFGTDLLGRDLFTRVLYGAQTSLQVGISAVLIATSIGLVAGALAGYYGGKVDTLIMRVTDVFLAFPYLLLAIAVIVALGRSKGTVIVVIGFLGWMAVARLFRSRVLSVKEAEYVESARCAGCSDFRIITRHILPNAIQPVIVYATIFVGTAVLSEAALSFLGAGIVEPTAAWGLMVADGRRFLFTSPHMLFFPGAAIFVTVMAFVFVGDGLRDALDPKLR